MLMEMRQNYVPPSVITEKTPPLEQQPDLTFSDFLQQWLCV